MGQPGHQPRSSGPKTCPNGNATPWRGAQSPARFKIVVLGAESEGGRLRQLPRGPHSLTREQVSENQRSRLLEAMVRAVGERGYANATVADVIARAGVSRKAFYEHFHNREHCFMAAYDAVTSAGARETSAAYHAAASREEGVQAAVAALFAQAAANPHAVRLALTEIGGVAGGHARHERHTATCEELLRHALCLPHARRGELNPVLRALVGGVNEVLCARTATPRQLRAAALVPGVVAWISSYRPTPAAIMRRGATGWAAPANATGRAAPANAPGGRAPGTLRPGEHGRRRGLRGESARSQSYVAHNQRERILDTIANLSLAKGYAAVTVREIAEHAAVSLETFYVHFAGKEDAFQVAYDVGHGRCMAIVERALRDAPDRARGVRAAIAALFGFLASEPVFAHLALVAAPVATRRTAEQARRGQLAYRALLTQGLDARVAASLRVEAAAGGVAELCHTYAVQRRAHELPALAPCATYFALAPFLGVEAAARLAAPARG